MRRKYLLDSGPAQDFLFDRRGIQIRIEQVRLNGARIGIGTPNLGEIIGGIQGSDSREVSWKIAQRRLGKLICWTYDQSAAHAYGQIIAYLRKAGRPMQQIDIQIAAMALTLGNCTVVTTDSDLSAIPGLDVENWS
jgi:tRNA(fMet)-specific endonuclease VapC